MNSITNPQRIDCGDKIQYVGPNRNLYKKKGRVVTLYGCNPYASIEVKGLSYHVGLDELKKLEA